MKARLAAILSREESLFKIDSNDLETLSRGRLLQLLIAGLVLPLTLLTVTRLLLTLVERTRPVWLPFAFPLNTILLVQVVAVFVAALAIWWLRQGRLRLALHVSLAVLDVAIILLSLEEMGAIPYIATITLLPVLASAVLGSLRDSIPYVAVTLVILPAVMAFRGQPIVGYTIINLVLVMSIVALSDTLNRAARETRELTRDVMSLADTLQEQVMAQTATLRLRANHLSHSVEIGRVASLSLNRAELAAQTTRKIRELFAFDEVSILLLDEQDDRAVLREAGTAHSAACPDDRSTLVPVEDSTLVGWVARNGVSRVAREEKQAGGFAEFGMPLIARGAVLGVLYARRASASSPLTDDPVILQLVADQLAASLENARLFAESERRASLLGQLPQIASIMASQATVRNVLNAFALRVRQLLGTAGAAVWLQDAAGADLQLAISYVGDKRQTASVSPASQSSLLGQLMLENRTMVVEEMGSSGRDHDSGIRLVPGVRPRSVLVVPLRREREPVGVATFGRVTGDPSFSGEEIQFAEALSLQLAVILQNNSLLAEANRLARHEKQINEITTRLRGSLDAQIALETAAESLGLALGDVTVGIRLMGPQDTGPPAAGISGSRGAAWEARGGRPDE